MEKRKLFWKELFRTIKYFLVAASAGLIQIGVLELMSQVLHIPHWISYLTALIISVLWNFTINRKITFKSVGNIPRAMLKVVGYYCVFTPLSVWFIHQAENVWLWSELGLTFAEIGVILFNGLTEYIFMRLFVSEKKLTQHQLKRKNIKWRKQININLKLLRFYYGKEKN